MLEQCTQVALEIFLRLEMEWLERLQYFVETQDLVGIKNRWK